ncbi:MAG: DUF1211 domain-containing protein [Candidatus Kerfeldbacteria bacterium]|nr:DUF1211 domain-containing protein [Candidatus Kerfeldbacteria bacterium]
MNRTTSRIETLADGVFAISMTLLVLNVTVQTGLGHKDFLEALRSVGPKVLAYMVSFSVIAVYWIGHHNQYFWIKHTDRTFLWINVFFLMAIAFIPFSTSLIAAYPQEVLAILIYGANAMAAGILLLLHWNYAAGRGKLVPGHIDAHLATVTQRRITLGIVFYAVATGLSFLSPKLSVALLVLLPLFYMRSSEIDRFLKGQHSE